MKIIVVDDERHALNSLERALKEVVPDSEILLFDRGVYALDHAKSNKVDVAFLDVSMPEMNGVELAAELKKTNRFVNVIFCTGHSEYLPQAIELHASGYILKPADKEDVYKVLGNLLHPVEKEKPRFYAKTFGNFDFFAGEVPVRFKRKKSKELLAYLISIRGATANRKELSAILFDDRYDLQTQNYLTKIYSDLVVTLKEYGAEHILRKDYNSYSVDVRLFSCDLYDYDEGKPEARSAYKGEFMLQYEWAEF